MVQVDDDYELTIFSIHHQSGAHHHFRREAEAMKTAEIIRGMMQEDPSRNIVAAGDFNAAPWDSGA